VCTCSPLATATLCATAVSTDGTSDGSMVVSTRRCSCTSSAVPWRSGAGSAAAAEAEAKAEWDFSPARASSAIAGRTRRLNITLPLSARQHACNSDVLSPHGEASRSAGVGAASCAALDPLARSTRHVHASCRVPTASAVSFSARTTNLRTGRDQPRQDPSAPGLGKTHPAAGAERERLDSPRVRLERPARCRAIRKRERRAHHLDGWRERGGSGGGREAHGLREPPSAVEPAAVAASVVHGAPVGGGEHCARHLRGIYRLATAPQLSLQPVPPSRLRRRHRRLHTNTRVHLVGLASRSTHTPCGFFGSERRVVRGWHFDLASRALDQPSRVCVGVGVRAREPQPQRHGRF